MTAVVLYVISATACWAVEYLLGVANGSNASMIVGYGGGLVFTVLLRRLRHELIFRLSLIPEPVLNSIDRLTGSRWELKSRFFLWLHERRWKKRKQEERKRDRENTRRIAGWRREASEIHRGDERPAPLVWHQVVDRYTAEYGFDEWAAECPVCRYSQFTTDRGTDVRAALHCQACLCDACRAGLTPRSYGQREFGGPEAHWRPYASRSRQRLEDESSRPVQ